MRYRIRGGYDDNLGEVAAEIVVEIPFAPFPGMILSISGLESHVIFQVSDREDECLLNPVWDTDKDEFLINVFNYGDAETRNRVKTLQDVSDWLKRLGWTIIDSKS